MRSEILELQEAEFHLQSTSTAFSLCCLFTTSKMFKPVLWTHPSPLHADRISSSRNGKNVRRNNKAPMEAHRNQWESARNVKANILRSNLLLYPGLGAIIVLHSRVELDEHLFCTMSHCAISHLVHARITLASTHQLLGGVASTSIASTFTIFFIFFAS
jgi:hypothetical protein